MPPTPHEAAKRWPGTTVKRDHAPRSASEPASQQTSAVATPLPECATSERHRSPSRRLLRTRGAVVEARSWASERSRTAPGERQAVAVTLLWSHMWFQTRGLRLTNPPCRRSRGPSARRLRPTGGHGDTVCRISGLTRPPVSTTASHCAETTRPTVGVPPVRAPASPVLASATTVVIVADARDDEHEPSSPPPSGCRFACASSTRC